jgi:hypothetical protein
MEQMEQVVAVEQLRVEVAAEAVAQAEAVVRHVAMVVMV